MKFILLMFFLCSCKYHQSEYRTSEKYRPYRAQTVSMKLFNAEVLESKLITEGEYQRISLKAHENLILDSDRFINLRIYRHDHGHRPLLIIQPISRGRYHIASYVANNFYQRGWNTLIVEREDKYKKLYDPAKINLHMKELVADSRHIIDWLYSQSSFSISRLAMFGISKGGIKTSLIMADDDRIQAGLIALAGGDLPSILTESNEKGVLRVRNHYLAKNYVSELDFKRVLENEFSLDPLLAATYIDGRKTMHILAYFDRSVPYKYGKQLYEAMPGACSYTLLAGHYSAILYLPFILNRTEVFFNDKLDLRN